MANPVFDAPQYQDEKGAFAYVESRLWPNGATCPIAETPTASAFAR